MSRHHCRWMDYKIYVYDRRLIKWPLSMKDSLFYHTCCDTRPRFFGSHSKGRPNLVIFHNNPGACMTYSTPHPHGMILFPLKVICLGQILVRLIKLVLSQDFDMNSTLRSFMVCRTLKSMLCWVWGTVFENDFILTR